MVVCFTTAQLSRLPQKTFDNSEFNDRISIKYVTNPKSCEIERALWVAISYTLQTVGQELMANGDRIRTVQIFMTRHYLHSLAHF